MAKRKELAAEPPPWEREHTCPRCGRQFTGNSFYRHLRSCSRHPMGETVTLYHVQIPTEEHAAFHAWCRGKNLTLAEGVRRLITSHLRRIGQ